MNPSKLFPAAALLCLLAGAPARALPVVIYSNTTTDTGTALLYGGGPFTQLGDEISLAGTDRAATSATVQFFNAGLAGNFDATLRLFNRGAPVGSQIGPDFVQTAIFAPAGDILNVSFVLPVLLVPDSLIFTVQVGNQSPGVDIVGLDLFEPPTAGSSDNTFAIANNGSGFVQVGTGGNNVFFDLAAVPEPSTFAVGALVLAFVAQRRKALQP